MTVEEPPHATAPRPPVRRPTLKPRSAPPPPTDVPGWTPGRALVPLTAGAVLLGVFGFLVGRTAGPGWVAWLVGVSGLALLVYGAVAVGRLERSPRAGPDLSQAQLQALIDASPLAIAAGDLEGRIILWSAAAERILGWTADEVLGRPYPAVPEDRRGDWLALRERVMSGETVTGVETDRVTRDGRAIEVSVSAAPITDGRGEIVGTVALIDDLSESRSVEAEVEQLESQLRQAQKLEVVGRLAAGIAHDFNNLLTAIRGNTELILAGGGGGQALERDLREIARSAERAAALTRQLLNFAYRGAMENRPLDVAGLVGGMKTLIERLIGEPIELRVELAEDTASARIDPNQLEQVVMNLVVNARDALPDGGQITIRTRSREVGPDEAASLPYQVRPGHYVLIAVSDDGIGMDPELQDQIFEPFFTTKPVGVGTGLGLSTTYSIVKQARGHIRVDSEPGAGTTFEIYLPRAEATESDGAGAERAEREVEASRGSETVLVVEDEGAVLSMARRTLERQGYGVLTALTGHEGVALAREHPGEIDVLFCDVAMPDLTGREVAERVRKARPEIRVLMTSGYGEKQLADEGVLQEQAFLAKPYTPRELTARIRQLLVETTPS